MTDLELLECVQSVYDFLTDDTDIRPNLSFSSFNEITSFKKMNDTLEKFGFIGSGLNPDMATFTIIVNNRFQIFKVYEFRQLLRNNPKDFFSTTKAHDFYRTIIRDLKLSLCLS